MARKKKDKTEKPVTPEVNISYSGNAKIQYMKGKKVYKTVTAHNAGTAELFRYIANCIIGNVNRAAMPRYICTFNTENGGAEMWSTKNRISNVVAFSTANVDNYSYIDINNMKVTTDGYVAELTFMFSYEQIHGTSDLICLYNVPQVGDGVTPLAYIKLVHDSEKDERIVLDTNNTTNIMITWQLIVNNAG